MKIREIHTPDPVCIHPAAPLDEAMRLMDEAGARHLPVVDDGRLAGVVSNRDLLQATGWMPARLRERWQSHHDARERAVSEVMHHPIMTVGPEDDVLAVAVEAVAQGLGCLPVIEQGRLQGIVTEHDLLAAFLRTPGIPQTPVARLMSREVRTVEPGASLRDARGRMDEAGVRHLPVVAESGLVGLLSDRDLRREAGRGRPGEAVVREAMTLDPVTVGPDAPLEEAVRRMVEHRIDALPVVKDQALVGILTTVDLLDPCVHALDAAG